MALTAVAAGAVVPPAPRATAEPEQTLIGFSLDRPPVVTWRLTRADLGIPDGFWIGAPFATAGGHAYLLSGCNPSCADYGGQWISGIDTATGQQLFPSFGIAGTANTKCYQSGSETALCLDGHRPNRVWALDLARGAVSHRGETDLDGGYLFFVLGDRLLGGHGAGGI